MQIAGYFDYEKTFSCIDYQKIDQIWSWFLKVKWISKLG